MIAIFCYITIGIINIMIIFVNNINKYNLCVVMASINQLVSEIANSIQQADNVAVRRALELSIIQARNTLIRRRYSSHKFVDSVVKQRVRIELINTPDGDINMGDVTDFNSIKRSKNKIKRPVTFINNLPYHSVRTIGSKHNIEIPYVKEASAHMYKHLPGMCNAGSYDYINGYLYISAFDNPIINNINSVVIEGVFEAPQTIDVETKDGVSSLTDDEFLLPEDMIYEVKKLVMETFNPQIIRVDGSIPNPDLIK